MPHPSKPPWRHHTVPKVLLKAFLNEERRVWTRLVESGRIVQLSLNDASVRGGFHTREDGSSGLEHFLATEVEGPFGKLLAEGVLGVHGPVAPPRKRTVSMFFLSQFLRVSGARAAYRTRAKAFIDRNIGSHHARLKKLAKHFGAHYEQRETEATLRAQIESADLHIDLTEEMILKHTAELERRTWHVMHIPPGRELVLSDAPAKAMRIGEGGSIDVMDFQGVARLDHTLFMPLSPGFGLIGASTPRFVPLVLRLDPLALNQVTAMGAGQVYARSQDALHFYWSETGRGGSQLPP